MLKRKHFSLHFVAVAVLFTAFFVAQLSRARHSSIVEACYCCWQLVAAVTAIFSHSTLFIFRIHIFIGCSVDYYVIMLQFYFLFLFGSFSRHFTRSLSLGCVVLCCLSSISIVVAHSHISLFTYVYAKRVRVRKACLLAICMHDMELCTSPILFICTMSRGFMLMIISHKRIYAFAVHFEPL